MVVTTVQTFGFAKLYGQVNSYTQRMSGKNRTRAAMAGARVAKEAIAAEMSLPKSGVKWSNLPERSSSPSELPAAQSGQLIREMQVRRLGEGEAALDAESPQAWWMEFGFMTKDGNFHIRPFMRPGVIKHRGEILTAMKLEMLK